MPLTMQQGISQRSMGSLAWTMICLASRSPQFLWHFFISVRFLFSMGGDIFLWKPNKNVKRRVSKKVLRLFHPHPHKFNRGML